MADTAADPWAVVAQDDFSAPAADDPWAVASVDPWEVAETPVASDADHAAIDAAWTGAPQPDAPVAAEAGAPQASWAENTGRGIVSRAANLAGGFVRGVATTADSAADWLEQKLPLGQVGQDASGKWGVRDTTPEDLAKESPLLSLARSLEETKFGYVPRTTWEDFKAAPLSSFIPFVFEQGLISAPDMAAVMASLPAYVAARTGEIGQERAKNNDTADATVGDFLKAAPAAVGSALLERIGTRGALGIGESAVTSFKEVPAAALRAGKKEAATEAGQEFVENVGATAGTNKGFDLGDALEASAAGAIVGGPFGGTVRAGTAVAEAALAPQPNATPSNKIVGWQNAETGEGVSVAQSPTSPGPGWSPVTEQDAAPQVGATQPPIAGGGLRLPETGGVEVAPANVTAADVASPLSTAAISSGREIMNRAISGTYAAGDLAQPLEDVSDIDRRLAEIEARGLPPAEAPAPEAPRVSATSPLAEQSLADPLADYNPDAEPAPLEQEPLRGGERTATADGIVGVVLDVRDRNGVATARLADPQGRVVYEGPADTLLSPEEAAWRASTADVTAPARPTLADVTTPVSKRQPDFRQTNVRDVTGAEPGQGRGAVADKFAFPQRPSEPEAALPAPQVESADTPPAAVRSPSDRQAAAPVDPLVPVSKRNTVAPPAEKPTLADVTTPVSKREAPQPAQAPSEDAISLDRARGVRAYSGMSFSPEKRADSDIAAATEAVKAFREALAPLAKTDVQRAVFEEQVAGYKRRYAQHQNAMWDAKGRTLSPMITGPARFPVAKNNKALETERRRVDEFLAWSKKALPAAKKAVERAGAPEPAVAAGGSVRTVAEFDGAEIEADEVDQRARIYFDAKPAEDLRAALRKEGWLWSPKNEAWQRKLTDNALASARRILSANFDPKPAEQPEPEAPLAEKPTLAEVTTPVSKRMVAPADLSSMTDEALAEEARALFAREDADYWRFSQSASIRVGPGDENVSVRLEAIRDEMKKRAVGDARLVGDEEDVLLRPAGAGPYASFTGARRAILERADTSADSSAWEPVRVPGGYGIARKKPAEQPAPETTEAEMPPTVAEPEAPAQEPSPPEDVATADDAAPETLVAPEPPPKKALTRVEQMALRDAVAELHRNAVWPNKVGAGTPVAVTSVWGNTRAFANADGYAGTGDIFVRMDADPEFADHAVRVSDFQPTEGSIARLVDAASEGVAPVEWVAAFKDGKRTYVVGFLPNGDMVSVPGSIWRYAQRMGFDIRPANASDPAALMRGDERVGVVALKTPPVPVIAKDEVRNIGVANGWATVEAEAPRPKSPPRRGETAAAKPKGTADQRAVQARIRDAFTSAAEAPFAQWFARAGAERARINGATSGKGRGEVPARMLQEVWRTRNEIFDDAVLGKAEATHDTRGLTAEHAGVKRAALEWLASNPRPEGSATVELTVETTTGAKTTYTLRNDADVISGVRDRLLKLPAGRFQIEAEDPQAFVTAPDGSLDFGEITPEIAEAIGREAAPIRLRRGDEREGLAHIEARHTEDARRRGYGSVTELVADVARNFDEIHRGERGALLLVKRDGKDSGAAWVKLEPDDDKAAYVVKTATAVRDTFMGKENPEWRRSAQRDDTGSSAGVANIARPLQRKGPLGEEDIADPAADDNADYVTADLPALQADLEKRLAKMALGDKIAAKAVRAIRSASGENATGRYIARTVEVAIGAKDAVQTLGHEVIHALRDLGVLRPAEWSALERAARADKALMRSIDKRYPSLSSDERAEEAVAEMFGDWLSAQAQTRGFLRTAFERIRDFMAALGGALRGQGFVSAGSVFRAIEAGKVGARGAAPPAAAEKLQIPPRGDEKPGVYAAIKQWMEDRRNAPRLEKSDDAGYAKRFVIHPWHIANTDDSFAPVYDRVLRMQGLRDTTATDLASVMEGYFKGTDADKLAVNKVLEFGRLTQTDFSKDDTITFVNEAVPQAQLSEVGEKVTLTPKQAEMYRAVRAAMDRAILMFKQQFLLEAGFGRPGDPTTAKGILDLIDENAGPRETQRLTDIAKTIKAIEDARRSGYVPFSRFGDYTISVKNQEGATIYFERMERETLETQRAFEVRADKKVEALRKQFPASNGFTVGNVRFSPPTATSEFGDLDIIAMEKALEKGGATEETRQAAFDAVKAAFTAAGFRKHFISSKDTAGYNPDFERALSDYVIGISGYLARRASLPGIEEAVSAIPDSKPALRQYAKEHLDYVIAPQEDAHRWRQWMFFSHLAGSIGSAVVNTTQVPLVTLPYMSMFAKPARIGIEWARASKDAAKMFRPRHAGDNLGFDPHAAPADVRREVVALYEDGTLGSQVTLEQMGVSRNTGPRVLRSLSDKARAALELTGALFMAAERFNRLVTAIVAVRLARDPATMDKARKVLSGTQARDRLHAEADRLRTNADAAERAGDENRARQLRTEARTVEGRASRYGSAIVRQQDATGGFGPLDLARFVIDETHIVAGKVNRPKMMRGVGAAIFQFKNFITSMVELQVRLGTRYGADGRKALAMTLLAGFVAAGLSGITGGDDLRELVEMFNKHFRGVDVDFNKEIQEAIHDFAEPYIGDEPAALFAEFVRKGAFRSVGVDIASRIGMGDLGLVGSNSFKPLPLSVGERLLKASEELYQGDMKSAAAIAAPFALSALGGNLVKAYTMADSGLRTQDGSRNRIPAKELSASDIALRAAGFQSSEIARRTEFDRMVRRAETAVDDKKRGFVSSLGRVLAEDGMSDRALTRFNLIKGEPGDVAGWKQRIRAMNLPSANTRAAMDILDEVAAFNRGRRENETITLTRAALLNALKAEQGGTAARTVRKSARNEAERMKAAMPNMR